MDSKGVLTAFLIFISFAGCSSERVGTGAYNVLSNCPNAQSSGEIELKQKTLFSTYSYDYEAGGSTAFGFPSDTWTRNDNVISSTSTDRSCVATVVGEKVKQAAFICRLIATAHAECSIVVRSK